MRIGHRFNTGCAPLELAGKCLQFVDCKILRRIDEISGAILKRWSWNSCF